jgi:hypothetical protein
LADVKEQIEVRIQELTHTRTKTVRATMQESIVGLEEQRREAEERRAFVNHSISELGELVAEDADLFVKYCSRVQDLLRKDESSLKSGLVALVSSLLL